MRKLTVIAVVFILLSFTCEAQFDTLKRKRIVGFGNAVAYTGAMTGMYSLWYKNYPSSPFHFHNDNQQWLQMDKVGHAYSCYYEGVVGIDMMKWAGYSKKQSILIGGSYGFFIQTGVEIFDGFSKEWGASTGDIVANLIGTGLVVGQAAAWDEQRIWLKLSFSPSPYAEIRPELLGQNFIEHLFKDYNGQTYWASLNLKSFASRDSKLPPWLNIAVGYGIDGLVGGDDNIFERGNASFNYSHITRRRKFYLSPDIDFTRIQTNRKSVKIAFRLLNCLKFPAPSLSYTSGKGLAWYWIHY